MTAPENARTRERALRDLEREARHFRDQAALDDAVEDVRDLWLALADQLDGYVAAERAEGQPTPLDAPLFDLVRPP